MTRNKKGTKPLKVMTALGTNIKKFRVIPRKTRMMLTAEERQQLALLTGFEKKAYVKLLESKYFGPIETDIA